MTHAPSNPDSALRDAIQKGNIVFIAGTGVSMSATYDISKKSSHPQASWTGLLKHGLETAERMGQLTKNRATLYLNLISEDPTTQNLISAASTVTTALGGASSGIFKKWLEETIGQICPINRDVINALHALREADNLLATTNYDDVLIDHSASLMPVTWMDGDEIIGAQRNRELDKIIYLHGYWKRPNTVILDGRSYEQIARHEVYRDDLAAFWRTTTWVYVGCGVNGLNDPDFGLLLERHGQRARDASHWDFCLVYKKDQASFQRHFDDLNLNIVAVAYGDKHSALPVFLRSLLPAPPPVIPTPTPPPPPLPGSSIIPHPPAFFAKPDYIGRHTFVGRTAQLQVLTDWAKPTESTSILLFEAIGGNGKSMLTWEWTTKHAEEARAGHEPWAGRFWFSFYEKRAILRDFCLHALHYMTQQPMEDLEKKPMADLRTALLAQLHARPWLLILDGLERVLVAYHRIDAAEVRDEEIDRPTDKILDRDPCDAIRDEDAELLRALAAAKPSKILISSRLKPRKLLEFSGLPIPGVRLLVLPGLDDADAERLFCEVCGIRGTSADIRYYLKTFCDNHPLVIGVLAGLINSPGPHRGHFDAWAAAPEYGAKLNLASLDLIQSRNHILRAAMDALEAPSRQLLSTLALLTEAMDYDTVAAFNPHLPPEPEEVKKPERPEQGWDWDISDDEEKAEKRNEYDAALAKWENELEVKAWRDSAAVREAPKKLGETLQDLERRGLVQYDGRTRRYDLHPVVRGVAAGGIKDEDKERYGQRVVDYFSAQAHRPFDEVESIDELEGSLHLIRTLLKIGKPQKALEVYGNGVSQALSFNLGLDKETLAILRAYFPNGWNELPPNLEKYAQIWLANDAGCALGGCEREKESIAAHAMSLELSLGCFFESREDDYDPHLQNVRMCITNISIRLASQNRLAREEQLKVLALDLALTGTDPNEVFRSLLDRYTQLAKRGCFKEASQFWQQLDPMGRNWERHSYRRGQAEVNYARVRLWEGALEESDITRAESEAKVGRDWDIRKSLHKLRGAWRLEQGEWALAAASFDTAVSMAREVRLVDEGSETGLALAKHHLGQLTGDDARSEAERLAQLRDPAHRTLALLWLALGDHEQAKHHALAAYRWAWADGEPHVHRYELTKTTELLRQMNVPVPVLPPYDPAKDVPFPWEADVRAAIEKLKAEKESEEEE